MSIKDNKGNHRKLQKKIRDKITHISAAKCPFSVILYANDRILFFIFIDENICNFRKKTQINRGYINKFTYISADCHNLSNLVLN